MWLRVLAPLLLLCTVCAPPARAESYALDDVSRDVPERGRLVCPDVPLVRHRGTHVRYHKPISVYAGFVPHLERFEKIVADTAIEVYGRAPRKIAHLGTYNCRRIRLYATWISEHGLGNAIDVEGFDFAPVRGRAAKDVPKALRRGFSVRVEKHWNATGPVGELHARFLRRLTERLVADRVFRVILGPAYPGHHNHFHLDMAPYELVAL